MVDDRDTAMFKTHRRVLEQSEEQHPSQLDEPQRSSEESQVAGRMARPEPTPQERAEFELYKRIVAEQEARKARRRPPPSKQSVIPPSVPAPPVVARSNDNALARVAALHKTLMEASEPTVVRRVEVELETIEQLMRRSGLYRTDEIRPVNEARIWARWKLGGLLMVVERSPRPGEVPGPGRGNKSKKLTGFTVLLNGLGLTRQTAMEAQRLGTLPREEVQRALDEARAQDVLTTFDRAIEIAKPFWYKVKREQKHGDIQARAIALRADGQFGPFPLVYADPPWRFETYTPDGTHRMPDDHYPTLTDEEICTFAIDGKTIEQLAGPDSALFMWCTSSNIVRALSVMVRWGFEYKTHAVWDKVKIGMGLVFRNQHELLLYGSRGSIPKPVILPSSVFRFRATEHSAKPPEIRKKLEEMYPDFDARTRIELFCRGKVDGWTTVGYEAAG